MRRALPDMIDAIYDAAEGGRSWTAVGDDLCAMVGADRLYLGIPGDDGTLPNLFGEREVLDSLYADRYHRIDPLRLLASRGELGQDVVRRGAEAIPQRTLLSSEYFEDYAVRRRATHTMAGQLDMRGELLLGAFRSGASKAFSDDEVQQARRLIPHLRRGLQLRTRLVETAGPQVPEGGLAALDVLSASLFVVDGAMRVVFANRAAERFVADNPALRMVRASDGMQGRLCTLVASSPGETARLRALILSAAGGGAGGALRLRSTIGPDGQVFAAAILVAPAPTRLRVSGRMGVGQGPGQAVVVARDLRRSMTPNFDLLQDLFQLSSSEAAVLGAMLGGATAEQVAEGRQVSVNTVRRQIQGVLTKTEAVNLRDLERMVATLSTMQVPRDDGGGG